MSRYLTLQCRLLLLALSLSLSLSLGASSLSLGAGMAKSLGTAAPKIAASAQTNFEQGLAAYHSGKLQEAIHHWQRVLSAPQSPMQEAQTWGNLAIAYYETGQYLNALEANQAALAIFTELGETAAVGQVQSNQGNVYEALGEYDRAIAVYREALRIAQSTHDRTAAGVSLGNLGYLYSLQGDQAAAFAAHEQSLTLAREVGDREGEGHRLLNLGIAHHALEETPLAAAFYRQSLDVAREIGHRTLEARALSNLGMAAADTGRYEAAIADYEQSLAIVETLQNPELTAMTLNNLGHTLLAANRLDAAEARLREAIAQLDSLRSGLGDAYNVSIFDTQIYTYNLLTQILVAQNRPEAALEVAEAGRARAFAKLLTNPLNASTRNGSNGTGTEAPFSIDDIRQVAQQTNATLVEYSLVPEEAFRVQGKQRGRTSEVHIWVIQPDGQVEFRRFVLDTATRQLEAAIAMSLSSLGVAGGRGLAVVPVDHPSAAQNLKTLHQILINPIQDLLPDDPEARVIFIPQGDLFLVPFSALINGENEYLIQRHTILTAPSIQVLALTRTRQAHRQISDRANPRDWLVVGNPEMPEVWDPAVEKRQPLPPLSGAEQEALAVADLFAVEALTGRAASEQVVKERIETAHIIHLATHGLLEYGSPQNSGIRDMPGAIALASTGEQDGLLTSAEILEELSLQADLVVLSACDTGRGEVTGDGVIGLSRSLIAAGTPSVVVSLWSVPDAPTADLMVKFYEELRLGQDKAQALRQAMLATMKNHPDPKNWAAFTLIGEAQMDSPL